MGQDAEELILMNARQIASGLVRAICLAQNVSQEERRAFRISPDKIHFHDSSTTEIVWNDVQAILAYNEHTGENVPVPFMATEGYGKHYHTSDLDGGYIPGAGPHDHRDNFNGGFAFAIYHPGTGIPQQPWAQ